MVRRCSNCGKMGHNLRTCGINTSQTQSGSHHDGGSGLRLFGVQVVDLPNSYCPFLDTKKSFSMDCLPISSSSSSSLASSSSSSPRLYSNPEKISKGCLAADGVVMPASSQQSQDKRKGVPWTEEEHKIFLLGLEKLGKGDWRGISRSFVTTRTPTQVASHAQKYFLRQNNNINKIRKRHGLLDMGSDRLTAVCAKIFKTRDEYSNLGCPKTHQYNYFRSNSSKPARAPDLELTLAAPTPTE